MRRADPTIGAIKRANKKVPNDEDEKHAASCAMRGSFTQLMHTQNIPSYEYVYSYVNTYVNPMPTVGTVNTSSMMTITRVIFVSIIIHPSLPLETREILATYETVHSERPSWPALELRRFGFCSHCVC